jgi:cobalamin 5'-phosphate synthase/cobalamin synthase
MADRIGGLLAAFRFLTSLPMPATTAGRDELQRALVYFPLVGLTLGGILVLVDQVLSSVLARPLVDFGIVAASVLLSGALHLDGLIDSADGMLGHGSAERRLAAMHESWAGQHGTAAALAILLLQFAALRSLPEQRTAALLLTQMLGRSAIVLAYVSFPYARQTAGLSLTLKAGASWNVGVVAGSFALVASALLWWPLGPLLVALAGLLTLGVGLIAQHRLGGMSGDVYGGLEQLVETSVLLAVPILVATGAN